VKIKETNNFFYLTIALIFLLLVAAVVDQYSISIGHQIVQASTIITILAALASKNSSRGWFSTSMIFLAAVVVVAALGLWLKYSQLELLHLLILIGFYLYASYVAARQVLFTGHIDGNKIVGAICIYLLMGLVWALSYLFIAQINPGAFNGLAHLAWYENFSDATYYSFVTLTTLGYGDISPVRPIARFLVSMEAIFGVFYMAILVASLIGISTSKMLSDK
jgi:voltage-gated potassium channel